jgi:prolyl-tRNA editing enzyme YbaK/EbsC (Cys-tRNA(Pro) deacylase)
MDTAFPANVQRVAQLLKERGHTGPVRMLDDAARTAQEAADVLGVALGQIAKSIIFKRKPDGVAVLVVTAGDRRVDEVKLQALVCGQGEKLGRADAEFVKEKTGFSIGGVAPLAHATPPVCVMDESLWRFATVWAAAGYPHAVFEISPSALQALTQAPVADVTQDVAQVVVTA